MAKIEFAAPSVDRDLNSPTRLELPLNFYTIYPHTKKPTSARLSTTSPA